MGDFEATTGVPVGFSNSGNVSATLSCPTYLECPHFVPGAFRFERASAVSFGTMKILRLT